MTPLALILMLSLSAGCVLVGRVLFHYFQLESYQHPGYFRTLRRNVLKSFLPGTIEAIVWALSLLLFAVLIPEDNDWLPVICTSAAVLVCGVLLYRLSRDHHAKKQFRFTPRMKRLYAVSFFVFAGILIALRFCVPAGEPAVSAVLFMLFPLFLPLWVALSGLVAWPIEKAISEMYFRDAQRILRERKDLIRIGITGSWGKTSVKFILGTILSEKYNTLVTPSSFNTPMGVTRVIRSSLEPGHRVFIAEMGARHVGDIKEMCRLVHPEIGILTSVGPQHLDTFKTVERVAKTKYELIDALPENGRCFFPDDQGICLDLFRKTAKPKSLSGLDADTDDVWAEEITVSPDGSHFTLCTRDFRIPCHTALLGELNIRNIVLCASVAISLGLTKEQIARGISRLVPVEHRLQLIPSAGGITIIDDAFNSNIRGAEQAFRVLKEFPPHRIIITPGMVELGKLEYDMNREFGEKMAAGCDTAILVGKKRCTAIREGLISAGFPEDQIRVAESLDEAVSIMHTIARSGDTVLFENDLPDNYSE